MKILCLQLARFGDIFQTWPAMNAIRRVWPDCELHLLVRERFQAATGGLAAVDKIKVLPSRDIFEPLFESPPRTGTALGRLESFIQDLKSEGYDRIVNLTFSPSSSYLVDAISGLDAVVSGYTRYRDGFLAIPDDASSYFYAQVGTQRSNRIHLTDLFALVAGVELIPADFAPPKDVCGAPLSEPYIVIHVGASQAEKTCSKTTWGRIVEGLLASRTEKIVFVGAESDRHLVPDLVDARLVDMIGKTTITELFSWVRGAKALLGGDSMVVQMASLTNTKTLNISFPTVRFWETGPRAMGSRILWFENDDQINSDRVVEELSALLEGQPSQGPVIQRTESEGVVYSLHGYLDDEFSWEVVRALYMNQPFPSTESKNIKLGFVRLGELASLGLEQMSAILDEKKRGLALSILDEIDVLVGEVARLVPEVSPVVRWFQAEKTRVGPAQFEEVLAATKAIFEKLSEICQIYAVNSIFNESFNREDHSWKS